jgi:hypothetical protein
MYGKATVVPLPATAVCAAQAGETNVISLYRDNRCGAQMSDDAATAGKMGPE